MQSSLRSISFGVNRMETVREISGSLKEQKSMRYRFAFLLGILTWPQVVILVHVCVWHGRKRARAKPTTTCGKNALNENDNVPFSCWYFCWLRFFATLCGGLFEYTTDISVCGCGCICAVYSISSEQCAQRRLITGAVLCNPNTMESTTKPIANIAIETRVQLSSVCACIHRWWNWAPHTSTAVEGKGCAHFGKCLCPMYTSPDELILIF